MQPLSVVFAKKKYHECEKHFFKRLNIFNSNASLETIKFNALSELRYSNQNMRKIVLLKNMLSGTREEFETLYHKDLVNRLKNEFTSLPKPKSCHDRKKENKVSPSKLIFSQEEHKAFSDIGSELANLKIDF